MNSSPYPEILRKISKRLEENRIDWVLTGSLGLAIQGLPVEVHDIDIQTDQEGAYEFGRCFAEYVVKPVAYLEKERIRSHFGTFEIDGLKVEVMGALQKRIDNREWEKPVNIAALRRWVDFNNLQVPVLPLEYEYQAYLKLGRSEKAEIIRARLKRRKIETGGPQNTPPTG